MSLITELMRDVEEAYEVALLAIPPDVSKPEYDSFVRGFVAGAVAAARKLGAGSKTVGFVERRRRGNVIPIAEGRGSVPPRGA